MCARGAWPAYRCGRSGSPDGDAIAGQIGRECCKGMHDRIWAGVLVALAVGDQQAISDETSGPFPPPWHRASGRHLGHHRISVGVAWSCREACLASQPMQPHLPSSTSPDCRRAECEPMPCFRRNGRIGATQPDHAAGRRGGGCWASSRPQAVLGWAVMVVDGRPWAVLSPGFWLSFGAVAVLLYISSGRLGGLAGWRGLMRASWRSP